MIVSSLSKLIARKGSFPPLLIDILNEIKSSISIDLEQRCYELLNLLSNLPFMRHVVLNNNIADVQVIFISLICYLINKNKIINNNK